MVRILVISDVARWEGHEEAVDRHRPDLVLLLGDVVHDGKIDVEPAMRRLPEYRQALEAQRDILAVRRRLRGSPAFRQAFQETHVKGFWDFLAYAASRAPVLSVRGNNDSLAGGYDAARIEAIAGARDISHQVIKECGLTIAGSAFPASKPISGYRALAAKGQPDLVVSHDPHALVPRIQEILRPRAIVKGHFGGGNYAVNGCPLVLSERSHHVVLEYDDELEARHYDGDMEQITQHRTVAEAKRLWPWMEEQDIRMPLAR